MTLTEKRDLISPDYKSLSVSGQCRLLELPRSCFYFKPKSTSAQSQQLMKAIDRKFLECPFYGVERMIAWLNRDLGYRVSSKRVRRLYKLMGLRTIYPKRNLSKANLADYKYPYLLKGLKIDRPGMVWQADITYVPMFRGFMYMFAIIDVFSRKIMGWGISNTMTVEWCKGIMLEAVAAYGAPEIFNTDQGSQFTSPVFINALKEKGIQISMDGKGRALDNVFIERFWRSLKQEYIYLNPPNGGMELYKGVNEHINFYNGVRRHQALGDLTPEEVFGHNSKKAS